MFQSSFSPSVVSLPARPVVVPACVSPAQVRAKAASLCLIHTPCLDLNNDRLEPPLGLLYLASYARHLGHKARIVDLSARQDEDLAALIPDGFEVYGFSTYSVNYRVTRTLARQVAARNPDALLVAGGPHASALPAQVHADGFDIVVIGEGERAMAAILNDVSEGAPTPAPIVRGDPPDLQELPYPDYDLVDLSTYNREIGGQRCVSILSSRGCPFKCSFCNSNIMGSGRPIRFRSVDDVIGEIRMVKQEYGIHCFRFQDDVFTINRKRMQDLAPRLATEDIQYRCFARVNGMTREMADLLRVGGCVHVSFGVETGSPALLDEHAMDKGQTPAQIRNALNNAHDAGLRTRIFLIVGFPGETDETIEETLALVKDCPWDEFSIYPLIAYPGTPIHDDPVRFGITHIDRNYAEYLQIGRDFKAGFTIRTETFDENQVRLWRDRVIRELLEDNRTWAGHAEGFK